MTQTKHTKISLLLYGDNKASQRAALWNYILPFLLSYITPPGEMILRKALQDGIDRLYIFKELKRAIRKTNSLIDKGNLEGYISPKALLGSCYFGGVWERAGVQVELLLHSFSSPWYLFLWFFFSDKMSCHSKQWSIQISSLSQWGADRTESTPSPCLATTMRLPIHTIFRIYLRLKVLALEGVTTARGGANFWCILFEWDQDSRIACTKFVKE